MKKLLTCLIIVGILSIQSMYGKSEEITITKKDNDSEVEIASGDILILKLEAILGTGCTWLVVRNNPDLLEPLEAPTIEPIKEKETPVVGQPEYLVFRFEARSNGTDVLELHYFKIFEEEEKVKRLKTFKITVLIH